jgi:hypothetical protein
MTLQEPINTDTYTVWPLNIISSYEIIKIIKNNLTRIKRRQWFINFTVTRIKSTSESCLIVTALVS